MPRDLNDLLREQGHDAVREYLDRQHTLKNRLRLCDRSRPGPPSNLIISTEEFATQFAPPDYLIEGLMQKRFLYSLTAPTGAGKTAIALRICAHVDRGLRLAGREVDPAKVLFFAGENPDDVRMRYITVRPDRNARAREVQVPLR
jgi:hypothetical protein